MTTVRMKSTRKKKCVQNNLIHYSGVCFRFELDGKQVFVLYQRKWQYYATWKVFY